MVISLALLALICSISFFYEISLVSKSYRAKNWKKCGGELIRWDIEEIVILRSSFKDFRYRYVVSGKEYESRQVGFGFPRLIGLMNTMFQDSARVFHEVVSDAPRVTVYYSPDNPKNSVLVTGIHDYHIIRVLGYGFGLAITFIIIAMA